MPGPEDTTEERRPGDGPKDNSGRDDSTADVVDDDVPSGEGDSEGGDLEEKM